MKKWRKTLQGKIVCYLICILCIGLTFGAVIGSVFMYDYGFYHKSENSLQKDISEFNVQRDGYLIVNEAVTGVIYQDIDTSVDVTNLRYAIYDSKGKLVKSNLKDPFVKDSKKWKYNFHYRLENIDGHREMVQSLEDEADGKENAYDGLFYIAENTGVKDKYSIIHNIISFMYSLRYGMIFIGIAAFFGALTAFINLMCVAGRRNGSDSVYQGPLRNIPSDVLIIAYIGVFLSAFYLAVDIFYVGEMIMNIAMIVIGVMAVCAGLWLMMEFAVRIKARNLLKNTLCFMIFKMVLIGIKKFFEIVKRLPLIVKTLIVLGIYLVVDFFLFLINADFIEEAVVLWGLKNIFVVAIVVYFAFALRKLKLAGKELAEGNLLYKTDTSKLVFDLKEHGENLNSIAIGMSKAVEERMKSERMKTELITNVSHDIKNPLTSIISYADLISKEECDCHLHKEYSEVLVNKSIHLKRLLEDIVEISKIETGNLDINLTQCNGAVLLSQLKGEFEERCKNAGLFLVINQCDETANFKGDSRSIWRIFENMMSNICKYSMVGSRVYLDMNVENDDVVFTFKNTSREALNISVDELMERFVRGDKSRNTDGNGLGLSIADSLMKAQNGKMDIFIDGDLFKVTLKFKGV